MTSSAKSMFRAWRRYRSDQRGAAAVEFALVLTLMTIPILNAIDLAMYAWDRMQTDNAAQVAVQAAWTTCKSADLPATPNSYALCSGMPGAVTRAVQSTSLGTAVTWSLTDEGYYCITTAGSLTRVADASSKSVPADCSKNGGQKSDIPGDYVLITTSYTYSALFSGVSIASVLSSPITRTAWMRLG